MDKRILKIWPTSHLARKWVIGWSVIVVFAILIWRSAFVSFDYTISDVWAKILQHDPSGQSVVVAIDSKSLQENREWPWSRDVHGKLVDTLDGLGVKSVAFDIDFSAPRADGGDVLFGDAIARASAPVYLATFRAPLSAEMPDIYAEMWPNEDIRHGAVPVSVNYIPETSGFLRYFYSTTEFSTETLQSMPVAASGVRPSENVQAFNYATNIRRIPYYSYVDVLNGTVPKEALEGKTIFVGATAVELGDEYALPVYGIQSGVLLNVIAFENLVLGNILEVATSYISLILLGIMFAIVGINSSQKPQRRWVGYGVLIVSIAAFSLMMQGVFHIIIPVVGVMLCLFSLMAVDVMYVLHAHQLLAFRGKVAARESQLITQSLVSENHEGIIALNRYGEIDMVNIRAAELLDITNLAKGAKLAELAVDFCNHIDLEQTLLKPASNHEYSYYTALGKLVALDVNISTLKIDPVDSRFEQRTEPRHVTIIGLHDVSAQRLAAEAEREAKEAHAAISAAKSQLISTMTHELRTPLNSIIGFSDIIKAEMFGPSGADEYVEYSTMINSSGRQLLGVVNDMMLAARLQSHELDPVIDATSLNEVFEAAIDDAQMKMTWRDQQIDLLHADGDASLLMDAQLMQTALSQLIDNAAKFGGATGTIRIRTGYVDGAFEISIRDEGEGCDPALLSEITDMFKQGDSTLQRSFEGCGLGLYLVQEIVDLHHGKLILHSGETGGFTARIRLCEAVPNAQLTDEADADEASLDDLETAIAS